MFRRESSSFSSLFATNLNKGEASFLSPPGDWILLCFWFISTLQSPIYWCRVVLHSSSINIMLVKSKNCFVDLSLTPTRFLAPNFLITAEHEVPPTPPPRKTQLETRKCNYSRMKVWVLHEARPQWKPGKKTTFPVTRLYLEALDGVLILTIFLPAAVCVCETRLLTTVAHPQILWKQPAGVASCSD